MRFEGGQRATHHDPTPSSVFRKTVVQLVECGPVYCAVHGGQAAQFGVSGQSVEGDVSSGESRV